jgi:GTP-binding protein EngB required for normal cell division
MARRGQAAAVGLGDRFSALDEALALAEGRADPEALAAAQAVRARADERLARGDRVIVAAFAGGTGTGKSSLFNAVAGEAIAETGVRRPTTDEPQALVAGGLEEANPLLDWLGVRRRHVTDPDGLPEGLALVDLPDHDSVVAAHRATSARFAERVDLLVWVVDPLKYARRDLHHGALRPLAEHAAVVVVVLNHADALPDADRRACADDLRRLLEQAGLGAARLLVTSARTGEGIADLRRLLADEARRRRAAATRVAADLRAAAKQLRAAVFGAGGAPERERLDVSGLIDALATAGGVDGRAEAAAGEYRSAARAGTRSVLGGAAMALWAAVLGLVTSARSLLVRPAAARAAASPGAASVAVEHALLELVDRVAGPLRGPARARLQAAAGADPAALGAAVGQAVDAVALRPESRRWWPALRLALTLAELAALVGFLWLSAVAVLDWLQLPEVPVPTVAGEIAWPTALLVGGLLLRVAGGLVRRRAIRAGAARHAAGVHERLRDALERIAAERVTGPVQAELSRLRRLDEELRRAAA